MAGGLGDAVVQVDHLNVIARRLPQRGVFQPVRHHDATDNLAIIVETIDTARQAPKVTRREVNYLAVFPQDGMRGPERIVRVCRAPPGDLLIVVDRHGNGLATTQVRKHVRRQVGSAPLQS